MRLIDADELITAFPCGESIRTESVRATINNMPTIDIDRPYGKWKVKSFHECLCEKCGFSFDIMKCDFLENMRFCPNCGRMKGESDDIQNSL